MIHLQYKVALNENWERETQERSCEIKQERFQVKNQMSTVFVLV